MTHWLWNAIAATLIISCITLAFRWLMNIRQHPQVVIFVFKFSAALCLLTELNSEGSLPAISWHSWVLIAVTGILSNLGDIGQLHAIKYAPNPGYAQGVIFIFPVIVLVVSLYLHHLIPGFSAEVTVLQFLGVVLCVLGTWVLCLPEHVAKEKVHSDHAAPRK